MPEIAIRRQNHVKRESTWLLDHTHNITSQFGEDGILAKLLPRIGEGKRWCVDLGAWDGKSFSNTHQLMLAGWNGVLIEGNPERCSMLRQTYADNRRAHAASELHLSR